MQREPFLDSFGSQAAWGQPTLHAVDYMFTPHGTGWGLDRARFDRMLADSYRLQGGVLLRNTRFLSAKRSASGGWDLLLRNDFGLATIGCQFVIDATGRRGKLARQLGARRTVYDRLVGVCCIGQLAKSAQVESMTHVEACEYGWWYTCPVPGRKISIVLMSDADIVSRFHATRPRRWRSLLSQMPLTAERVGDVDFADKPRVYSSMSAYLKQVGGSNWVAVGDAAASHDPLSSTGIPHAIGSGVQGALAAADSLFARGQVLAGFQQGIHNDFFQYLRMHWQYYQSEDRWPTSLFWKRRRTPIRIDARAVVKEAHSPADLTCSESIHMPIRRVRQLLEHCQPGRPTHAIVSEFAHAHPEISDQHIILAMQQLAENGDIVLDTV